MTEIKPDVYEVSLCRCFRARTGRRLPAVSIVLCLMAVPAIAAPPVAQPHSALRFHHPPKTLPTGAVTSDWPTLAGPNNDMTSPETHLLKRWPKEGPSLVWEMEVGTGWAPPAVKDGRLVYFHRLGNDEVVECLDAATGQRFWQSRYASSYKDRYDFNNGPRCGPVMDGDRVYTYGAGSELRAFDIKTGRVLWRMATGEKFHVTKTYFGVGSTPLVEGERLIVQVGGDGGPTVVALDKRTGKIVWKAGKTWNASYAAPMAADLAGRRRVLLFAGGDSRPPTGGLLTIDPANGSIDSQFPFRGKRYESINASNPVVADGHAFLTTAYRTGGVLLDLSRAGQCKALWRTENLTCHFTTPIHQNGYLYGVTSLGEQGSGLVCLDWKTGNVQWKHPVEFNETFVVNGKKKTQSFGLGNGWLIRADGDFLCLGEYGHLAWFHLSPDSHQEISRAWLFGARETFTPPALSNGLLYVCQNKKGMLDKSTTRLLCYDLRADK